MGKIKKGKTPKEKKKPSVEVLPPIEFHHEPPSMVAENLLSEGVVIWRRNSLGFRVQQLQSEKYYSVLDLLQLQRKIEAEIKEEEEARIEKFADDVVDMRKHSDDQKSLKVKTRNVSQLKKRKDDSFDYDEDLMNSVMRPSDNPSATYKSAKIIKGSCVSKPKSDEIITDDVKDDESSRSLLVEVSKKRKTEIGKAKDKAADKVEKVQPLFEAPKDTIPVEIKSSPPTYIFDDTYQDYKDQTLKHFMKIRYKLFHYYSLLEACEGLCYYKIYIWSVAEPFQNKGIGSDLLDAAVEMCYQLEIPMMVVICTSQKSQGIATRAGFVPITRLHYNNMIGAELYNEKVAVAMIKYLNVPVLESYIQVTKEKVVQEEEVKKKNEESEGSKDKKKKKKKDDKDKKKSKK
ncbi:hypothetical protein O3M35_001756 [Rhynocoris fuscipes]|uniref:N-acetyltransferase domain-containing protein n=1 Tax=Rhynocoris fuscipes TaxID=488301 RepID=A0AAW1CQ10_9HEMI